jgi:hypothetical protein
MELLGRMHGSAFEALVASCRSRQLAGVAAETPSTRRTIFRFPSKGKRMPFSHFDASTKALLTRAYQRAYVAAGGGVGLPPQKRVDLIAQITRQLLAAADAGERDHDRLVQAALVGVARS